MSDVNYRLGLAVRRADAKFEQAGGDTTMQWIPYFLDELEQVGLEICPTSRATDGANLREDNVVLQNIGGGTFVEVPQKSPRRKRKPLGN